MAVTLPGEWSLQEVRNIQAGRKLRDDTDHDLTSLARRQNQAFAGCVKDVIAHVGVGPGTYGTIAVDEAGTVALTTRASGVWHHWSTSARVRFHVEGENVNVRVTMGGVVVTTLACGAAGWYSTAVVDVAGMTAGGDGQIAITVEVNERVGVGTREWRHIVIEEVELPSSSYLPDSSSVETDFQRLDDQVGVGDMPFDGFIGATFARSSAELLRVRTRGTCIMQVQHPDFEPWRVSSVYERADGPYVLEASLWSDAGVMSVVVEATTVSVDVAAFTEHESRAAAIGRLVNVAAGSGQVLLTFTGLKIKPGQDNRFYLYLRSNIGSEKGYSPVTISGWNINGPRELISAGGFTSESVSWPVGGCLLCPQLDTGLSATDKSVLTQDRPVGLYDLAASATPSASASEILVSPSPVHLRPPSYLPVDVEVYDAGVLTIHGTYVGESAAQNWDATDVHNSAAIGSLPPASVLEVARRRINLATLHGTPMGATRHGGQHWTYGDRTAVGPRTIHQRGRYVFVESADSASESWIPVARWAIPSDPTVGAKLNIATLRAAAEVLVVRATGYGAPTRTVGWRLTVGGVSGAAQRHQVPLRFIYDAQQQVPLTEFEAAIAAQCASVQGTEFWEHGYVQQLTWLADAFRPLWFVTPTVEAALPVSYPAYVDLEVDQSFDGDPGSWIIIPSARWSYGPRVSP